MIGRRLSFARRTSKIEKSLLLNPDLIEIAFFFVPMIS